MPRLKSVISAMAGDGLLGRVLDEVNDLHPELRAAIEEALRG